MAFSAFPRFSPFRAAPLSPRFSPFRVAPLSPRHLPHPLFIVRCAHVADSLARLRCASPSALGMTQSLSKRKFFAAQFGHRRRGGGNTFICLAALGCARRRLLSSARKLA